MTTVNDFLPHVPYQRLSPGYFRRDRNLWRPEGTLTVSLVRHSDFPEYTRLFPLTANWGCTPLAGNLRLHSLFVLTPH